MCVFFVFLPLRFCWVCVQIRQADTTPAQQVLFYSWWVILDLHLLNLLPWCVCPESRSTPPPSDQLTVPWTFSQAVQSNSDLIWKFRISTTLCFHSRRPTDWVSAQHSSQTSSVKYGLTLFTFSYNRRLIFQLAFLSNQLNHYGQNILGNFKDLYL